MDDVYLLCCASPPLQTTIAFLNLQISQSARIAARERALSGLFEDMIK